MVLFSLLMLCRTNKDIQALRRILCMITATEEEIILAS